MSSCTGRKGLIAVHAAPTSNGSSRNASHWGWLDVTYLDACYAKKVKQGIDLAEADYLQHARSRAQRPYIAALRALAQVQRLPTAVLQVNVAERQVNIA